MRIRSRKKKRKKSRMISVWKRSDSKKRMKKWNEMMRIRKKRCGWVYVSAKGFLRNPISITTRPSPKH